MEDMCLALLELLKSYFMEAKNYSEMKRVFLKEPCRIYTKDVQTAWRHVQKGRDIRELPDMNRQALKKKSPVPPTPVSDPEQTPSPHSTARSPSPDDIPPPPSASPTPSPSDTLPTAGLKNLRLELAFTPQTLRKERWLDKLNVGSVRLTAKLYFGSVKLEQHTTKQAPVSIGTQTDRNGNTVKMIDFLEEHFTFENQDISELDLEQDLGAQPIAIIIVEYLKDPKSRSVTTLGWARVRLFRHKSEVDSTQGTAQKLDWALALGDDQYPLKFGFPPGGAASGAEGAKSGLITSGSIFGAKIFHPNKPAQTEEKKPKKDNPTTPSSVPAAENTPEDSTPDIKKPFDLYVDKVDNIPDNASIVKVTGKFLKIGDIAPPANILALPDMSGPSRSPEFTYRLAVNEAAATAGTDMVLLLRLYIVTRDEKKICIVGSCLANIFDDNVSIMLALLLDFVKFD
jgi:hypothetical protein